MIRIGKSIRHKWVNRIHKARRQLQCKYRKSSYVEELLSLVTCSKIYPFSTELSRVERCVTAQKLIAKSISPQFHD